MNFQTSRAPDGPAGAATLAIARAAEHAVEHGASPDQPLLDILHHRLGRERDAGLRLRLARAYLRLLSMDGRPVAVEWVRGGDPMLRQAAYDALHDLKEDALPALLELAGSRDESVRWCAYEVAAHLHRPSMIPVLVRGLQDPETANRWAAANGLIAVGQPALRPVIEALVITRGSLGFHHAARRVLGRLEAPGYEGIRRRLLESLAHDTTTVQSGPIAAEWLAALRCEAAPMIAMSGSTIQRRPQERVARRESEDQMTTRLQTNTRTAEHADAPAVQALWERCELARAEQGEWDALIDGPTSTVLVAEYEGDIVGSVVATFDGWRAYVYHVAVAPHVRRQGVGASLIAEAEQYLLDAGARYVYTAVHEENTDGLAMAVGAGYLPEGERVLAKTL